MDNQQNLKDGQRGQIDKNYLKAGQQVLQLSSYSQYQPPPFRRPDSISFIKSLRHGFGNSFISIYQDEPFTVQFRTLDNYQKIIPKLIRHQQSNFLQASCQVEDLTLNDNSITGELHFQTVPYDCLQFKQNFWMISTKGMPPRIYKRLKQESNGKIYHLGSISNKKKNSQQYLSPLQITSHEKKSDYAIGGGRKFLCSYNLQLGVHDLHFQHFDKVNISAVQMATQDTVLVGNFQGGISIVDLRMQEIPIKVNQSKKLSNNIFLRPHVDAVMSLVSNKQNHNIFVSSARKDNYIYVWDCRLYGGNNTKYLAELIVPRVGNQRISLDFNSDGTIIYTGSESSEILGWHYGQQGNELQKWKIFQGKGQVVNSVLYKNGVKSVIFSTGSRNFGQANDSQSEIFDRKCRKHENALGFIKL